MKNKTGSIDVVFLVFMAVILSGWALFVFISNSGQISSQIKDSRFLDNFYVNENKAEFYINMIMDESVKGVDVNENIQEGFIKEFNKNFFRYKELDCFIFFNLNSDLANLDNVFVENNKIFLKINFNGDMNFDEGFKAKYFSQKTFVKEIE